MSEPTDNFNPASEINPNTLWLLCGAPFSGKGEYMRSLQNTVKASFFGVGDICRDECTRQTDAWKAASRAMEDSGSTLWPTEILAGVVETRLTAAELHKNVFLDGALRRPDQKPWVLRLMRLTKCNRVGVLNIQTTDEECRRRQTERGPRTGDHPLDLRLLDWHEHGEPAAQSLIEVGMPIAFGLPIIGENMREDAPRLARGLADLYSIPRLTPVH